MMITVELTEAETRAVSVELEDVLAPPDAEADPYTVLLLARAADKIGSALLAAGRAAS